MWESAVVTWVLLPDNYLINNIGNTEVINTNFCNLIIINIIIIIKPTMFWFHHKHLRLIKT